MNKVENYLLGMDCGTTNIKAVIIGARRNSGSRSFQGPIVYLSRTRYAGAGCRPVVGKQREIFRALCEEAGYGGCKADQGNRNQFPIRSPCSRWIKTAFLKKCIDLSGYPFWRGNWTV